MWSAIGDPDGRRLTAGSPGRADQPADRLGAQVGALPAGIRPDQPERRTGGVDHAGVARRHVVVAEAPRLHRSRLEVGDHDVRPRGQPQEDLAAFGPAQVDGDAALATVARREVGAAVVASCTGSHRAWSPNPGSSTLMTSAPHSPSVAAACGPCTSSPASTTLIPSSAPATAQTSHCSGTRSSISCRRAPASSPSSARRKSGIRRSHSSRATISSLRARWEPRQRWPPAANAEVLGELTVQLELVGVVELAGITIGRRQPEPHDVALLHRAAVEVDVLGDVAAVLDEQAVEADELLDGVGDQLGLVDERPTVGLMGRQVVEDVPQLAARRVEARPA